MVAFAIKQYLEYSGSVYLQILDFLTEDSDFFKDLFQRLRFSKPGSDMHVEIVAFLQELTSLSKCLQQQPKRQLFQKLVHLGLFEVRHNLSWSQL